MSAWADGLPGARRMAREMERVKEREREGEREKAGVNVAGLVRGRGFNFGYDMGEIALPNESEISETHSNTDESPRPSTNPTKNATSSYSKFYNIPSHQRRYRIQGHPSPYNDDASSNKRKQAMMNLWLEQNPTQVFCLPSPEEDGDAVDDNEHVEIPMKVQRSVSQKGNDAHSPSANPTRVWRAPFPTIEEGDDDDGDDTAHAEGLIRVQFVTTLKDKDDHTPPAAGPARVWRVPSPSDDDDEDNGDGDTSAATLPTEPSALNKKRHVRRNPPRLVREVPRMGRHVVTNPGDAECVSEDFIFSRGGGGGGLEREKISRVERKKKGAGVEKKKEKKTGGAASVERRSASSVEKKKGSGTVKKVRRGRHAKKKDLLG